ncbi:MAG: glycosyltransferase family protein [Humibacter sp.]
MDAPFYAAQLGLPAIPAGLALAHYVAKGFRRGLSVNPLFDEITAGGNLPEVFRVPAMYAYLVSDKVTVAVHPLWDAPAYGRTAGLGKCGPLEHAWARPQAVVTLATADRSRHVTVAAFRDEARRAAASWRRLGSLPHTVEDGEVATFVLRVVQKSDRRYGRKLAQVARLVTRGDAAAAVSLISPDASQWIVAQLWGTLFPEVTVDGHGAGIAWTSVLDQGLRSRAARVLVALDPRCEVGDDDIRALAEVAATGRAAAPVLRAIDGTIVGAGASRIEGFDLPYRILAHHPAEDLAPWGSEPIAVPMLTGRTVAIPTPVLTTALRNAGGRQHDDLLELLTDHARSADVPAVVLPHVTPVLEEPEHAFATRRWSRRSAGAASHAPSDRERATALLAQSGFEVRGWRLSGDGRPEPVLAWIRPRPDAQRWAIKIGAPAGRAGAVWGETHFALGLARALRRRGHDVVIDAFGAARRPSAYLDDVSVVVRGPYRIDPPDTGTRIEWIISHPDEITPNELRRFDRVFAASRRWSAQATARWSIPVAPLLECTDADQFFPRGLPRGEDIVFVGTARGIARPSVVAPLAAGIQVRVYGPDWRPFIPSSAVAAEFLPNTDLPARYETASIVLNDQWPAMREQGFIAMRPFDVVAVAGRVISEDVDEIEEIFRGAVVAYRDAEHLVELLRSDPDTLFPPQAELERIAAYVREQHSFDARADVLLRAADDVAGRQTDA